MAADPLSPIAPARLRALLLPVGRIKRSRFLNFVKRLQGQNVVRLGDVSPDGRPNRNSFSPLAFPAGMIVYDLSISVSPTSHLELFPFEIFREPLAVIAIADGIELVAQSKSGGNTAGETPSLTGSRQPPKPEGLQELTNELSSLRENYPRSLVRRLLVFDYEGVDNLVTGPEDVTWIPRPEASRSTTVKTVMCDITSLILGELDNFAEGMQDWPTIDSPRASSWGPRRAPESRTIAADKLQNRMTMPTQLLPRPNGISNQSSDPSHIPGAHESPTTFDEISRSLQLSNRATAAIKSSSKPGSKEHSRERLSVQGLGYVSAGDRSKSRLKGRLSVVIGNLFLAAGRWPDALKELCEGAAIARASSDYIWHAKALESILLCLLMFGWAGMEFQIPHICYPSTDKSVSKSANQTPTPSVTELYKLGQSNSESRLQSLQNLVNLLPDISNNILNLYTRAANITDEPLPQLVFSETVIRLARLLSTVHVRDGRLDDEALSHIVMNEPLRAVYHSDRPRGSGSLRKTDIASLLFRALPPSPGSDIPATDSIPILIGTASVLSTLRLVRKKAFVLNELFSILVPALVQARKIGAAEIGIHPAAGLPALNNGSFDINALDVGPGNMEESLRTVLSFVGEIYGVQGTTEYDSESDRAQSPSHTHGQGVEYDSVEAITERTFRHCTLNAFGNLSLKIEILRACINFCEALPDFQGVLEFTVKLLRTARGVLMLIPDSSFGTPILAQEEQVRLFNNVKRTVGAANRLGAANLEAEYWDEFLVRGVELIGLSDANEPVQRSKSEFGVACTTEDHRENGPFIYNAFSKATPRCSESLLIAGEPVSFKVSLQNPYEFDVEIESLRLEGEGVSFQANTQGVWLAPFSIQEKIVSGMATTKGTLKITGCIAKVNYCRERRFPIFKKVWKPEPEYKLKRRGLAAKEPYLERPPSWASNASATVSGATVKGPEPESLIVKVINAQPTVILQSTSLSQSAIMVLEGETRSFEITLRNVSTCPVDLIFFTFQDSTTRQLQSALNNKDKLPADVYELELQLSQKPALRWRREGLSEDELSIAPGQTSTFSVEVFGKPGLLDAVVQIDYCYVGVAQSDIPETFYCRQIFLTLAVTVNASVDVARCDILPFNGDFGWAKQRKLQQARNIDTDDRNVTESTQLLTHPQVTQGGCPPVLCRTKLSSHSLDHCLLLLDLRNAWPNPLLVSLSVKETIHGVEVMSSSGDNLMPMHEVKESLQPGHMSRFVLVVPRIFLDNRYRAIPVLNACNRRQFVVSANTLTHEAEASSRQTFWFREELLQYLRGSWKEEATGREGEIELRGIRLSPRMVDALRVEDVEVAFSVCPFVPNESSPDDGESGSGEAIVTQTGHSKFAVKTNTFLTIIVSITNNSSKPIHAFLRLQPSLRNQPHTIALDLWKRFTWTGMLHRALPVLATRATATTTLGATALCRGEYEISASVEELRLPKISSTPALSSSDRGTDSVARAGDAQEALRDSFSTSAPRQRRIWHSRVPCVISARG